MWFGRVHDAHPSLGPVIFTAATLYFLVQIIVAWVFVPSYSLVSNSISDLGDTSCGGYGSPGMCSPIKPFGSTLCTRVSASGPACR